MNALLAHPPAHAGLFMDQMNAIAPWLHHLRELFPISNAVVIGAGNGADSWVSFLRESAVVHATLVEADDACFQQLQRTTADCPGWSLCHQLIAPVRGPSTFHRTTVPSENGLLDPVSLIALWPRISPRESIELNAITLADVIGGQTNPVDWLFLDCLPARPILQGGGGQLSKINVLVARATDCAIPGDADRESLTTFLESLGFQFLVFEPNRNPNTGHSLFIRNPAIAVQTGHELRSKVADLETRLTASESAGEGMRAEITELGRLRDSLRQQASDLETRLTASESNKAAVEARVIKLESLIPEFQTTISTLENALARIGEEQSNINRKLYSTKSQMFLLARFLDQSTTRNP